MNNEMDFEFELKKRFNEEAPELPESLKKENVIEMLEKNKSIPKKKKKHIFPKILATAAALVIVVASAVVVPVIIPDKPLVDATTQPAASQQASDVQKEENATTEKEKEYEVIDNGFKATALKQAEKADDLRNHFLKLYREDKIDDFFDGIYGATEDFVVDVVDKNFIYAGLDDAMPESGAAMNQGVQAPSATVTTAAAATTTVASAQNSYDNNGGTGGESKENYGQTNTQVENVDEADIIKNDGRYLYILSGGVYNYGERTVTIVDTETMKVVSKLNLKIENGYRHIQEMYVNGDRLILIATEHEREKDDKVINDTAYPSYELEGKTVSFVYDISDRENPDLVRKVDQDGSDYISSRMIDGVLYTVSSYFVRGESEEEVKENAIPDVNGQEIACDCIYVYDYDYSCYTVLSAYDTKLDDGEVGSLSILGAGDEVYCSQDALYVACGNYDYDDGDYTEIYSFSLDGAKIAYKASGTVKGYSLNQFSFDEYEGNLRVATTYYSYKHDVDVSSIYVLNKNLELIGALEDIAYDEQVKSVRFMGDTGFIVTFRNTDPLFTLDLSDPTAPKTVGEVKLPGFSSYLHPVGDGLVVGLGYDGDDENADFSSLKVSLFDVSDMKNPKEVDTFVLKNVSSAALYNHKAFIYYPEENLIGFPVEHYDNRTVLSYKLLKIENRVIESHLGYTHKTERMTGDVFRGTYIGDKLYTIDNYNVCEFMIDTAVMTRECEILDVEDDTPPEYIADAVTTPAVMPGGVVATTVSVDVMTSDDVKVETTTSATTQQENTTFPPDYITTTVAVTQSTTVAATKPAEYSFEAKVIELYSDGGALLVEVTEQGTSGLTVGTQAELYSTGMTACEKGDTLKIIFDGVVQETYPVKIPNVLGIGVSKR